MNNNNASAAGNDGDHRIIANRRVSKRTWQDWQTLLHWLGQETNITANTHRFEHEYLRLVYEPKFQDKYNRRAQVELVLNIATGGTSDIKWTGRLLTMRCLAGVGVGRSKARSRARLAARRVVEDVDIGEDVDRGEDEVTLGADVDQIYGAGQDAGVGHHGMEIDGHGDPSSDKHGDGNEDDMDLDDHTFNNFGAPPSSPTPDQVALPPKTPARPPIIAGLPTPDSTPDAQFMHGASPGLTLEGDRRRILELERENREMKFQLMHAGAVAREKAVRYRDV